MRHLTAALARRLRDDDRGMTLIELMVGISMGTLVTFAAFLAMDSATKMGTRTNMRLDTTNRARNAMENMTRAIRSQQCFNGTRPMLVAGSNAMVFYSSIAPFAGTTFQPPERRTLWWEAGTVNGARNVSTTPQTSVGSIYQKIERYNYSTSSFQTTVAKQRLAEDVELAPDRRNPSQTAPFFRYYKYTAATGSGRIDYSDPVDMTTTSTAAPYGSTPAASASDLAAIVLIEVSFKVSPYSTKTGKSAALNFYNTVSVRIADPTNPGGSPQCL